MLMKRFATALAVAVLSLAAFGAGTAAAEAFRPYTDPGTWFSPGTMYSGYYDWCGSWTENNFSKGSTASGLITFIDLGGNWHYGKQGTGWLRRTLSSGEQSSFVKKPHCRNNSGNGYQGGCFAFQREASCA
jgi:hypothetical protein